MRHRLLHINKETKLKTIEELIEECSIALPFKYKDMQEAYKLGMINILLELARNTKGYPVNGIVRGVITEEQLSDKLVEVSNDK